MIIDEIKKLLFTSLISKLLVFIKGLIFLSILSPADFGLINLITQIKNFSKYSDLGFISVIERNYNYYLSIDPNKSNKIKNIGYTNELVLSILFFIIIISISFTYVEDIKIFIAVIFSSFAFFFQKILRIYKSYFKINKWFNKVANLNLIESLFVNIIIIFLVFYIGVFSPLIFTAVGLFFVLIYLIKNNNNFFNISFNLKESFFQLKTGLILSGLTVLTGAGIYLERYIILDGFGLEGLGFFSIIFFINSNFQFFITDVSRPLVPRVREKISVKDYSYLDKYIFNNLLFLVIFLIICVFLIKKLIPVFISYFFIKYESSIILLEIMSPLIYYIGITSFTGYLLVSKGINKIFFSYFSSIVYLVSLCIFYWFLNINYIELIALGFTLCFCLKTLIILIGVLNIKFKLITSIFLSLIISLLPLFTLIDKAQLLFILIK